MEKSDLKNQYIPLIICTAAASFMVNLDTYIVNVAIPAVATDFSVSKSDVSWVIMSYNLMVVSLLLFFGKLADKIGVTKLFIQGFIVFTIASLFCAISQNLGQMIFSRILQGIGASVLYALPQAMICKYLPPQKRAMGFGFCASAAALGIMTGAPVSGLLTGFFSWHMIFLINIPIGIFVIVTMLKHCNQNVDRCNNSKPFDSFGAVMSFLATLSATIYLNRINSMSVKNIFMVILLFSAIVFFTMFIRHCLKTEDPVLDLKLFKNRNFAAANIAMFFISAFLAGNNFLMPFYLSEIKMLTEIQTGLIFILYSASYMIFSLICGKKATVANAKVICTAAAVMAVFSQIFFILCLTQPGVLYTAIFFVLTGCSLSFFIIANNNYVMSLAKKKSEGAVAGIHRTTGRFGMLFGVVIFELIYSVSGTASQLQGYKTAYLGGIIICIIAAVSSYICRNQPKKPNL